MNCSKSIAGIFAVFFLAGCGRDRAPDLDEGARESDQRLRDELAVIASRVGEDNSYLGDKVVRERREEVAMFGEGTPPDQRFEGWMFLGLAELNIGDERAAIAAFEKAETLATVRGVTPQMADKCRYFLGVAHLRLGETENCCAAPNADSCLFPLRAGGLHGRREGSEKAIQHLMRVIDSPTAEPLDRVGAMWLVNLAHMTLGQFPDEVPDRLRMRGLDSLEKPESGFPRFHNIADSLGINTFGLSGGAVFDDFDGDGWFDLVVSVWDPRVDLRYFKNNGDQTFSEHSEASNFTGLGGGLNLKQADYDNDGDLDLLVLRGAWLNRHGQHPNSLLRNEGAGRDGVPRFTDVTFSVGLGAVHYPTQTAEWADYDLDGDLDLFVGNETDQKFQAPCQLFRNDGPDATGRWQFTDVAEAAGVRNFRFSKGVSWGDIDGDRDPDLFISNLRDENRLYRNNGDGTFTDVAPELGLVSPVHSFPAWFWDFDNDGALDLFVSYYRDSGPLYLAYYDGQPLGSDQTAGLFQGDGHGGFRNVAMDRALNVAMQPMGSNFGDVDNDGFADIYLGTGDPRYDSVVPNILLLNRGGERFEDLTIPSGMGHLQKGHAVSFVDFDRDGDVDVFEQLGGAFKGDPYYDALFENPGFSNTHWLSVRLKGVDSNAFGVGSRIRAVIDDPDTGNERSVYAFLNSGGSFGANPLEAHLGLGKAEVVKRLEVFWPVTGETQVAESIPADRHIVITEGRDGYSTDGRIKSVPSRSQASSR